ncbi:MAG: hypothetical protein LBF16_13880 [Pseudomonadales bacterium]|jgi:hypothetical protein|nr:hypothetical protein [Pseudomonadales bacterium]
MSLSLQDIKQQINDSKILTKDLVSPMTLNFSVSAVDAITGLVVTMFNGAPGAGYLGELVEVLEAGASLNDIATALAGKDLFNDFYANTQSAAAFADQLAVQLLPAGTAASAVAYAKNWVVESLAAGVGKGEIILQAEQALLSTSDADFAAAKAQLQNRIDVAKYYSYDAALPSTTVANLQGVVKGVTAIAGTKTSAIETLKSTLAVALASDTEQVYTVSKVLANLRLMDAAANAIPVFIDATAATHGVTMQGTPGDDVFILNNGTSTYGGGGADIFIIDHSTIAASATAVIYDIRAGDKIGFVGITPVFVRELDTVSITTPEESTNYLNAVIKSSEVNEVRLTYNPVNDYYSLIANVQGGNAFDNTVDMVAVYHVVGVDPVPHVEGNFLVFG